MTPHARASLAHEIATGRPLPADAEAVTWALACLSTAHASSAQHRAAVVVAEYLDGIVSDDDTRRRLGLAPIVNPAPESYPAWVDFGSGFACLYLDAADRRFVAGHVGIVYTDAWRAYPAPGDNPPIAQGPETGEAGRLAAEAALRAAGVLAEGVVVRRPVGGGA